MSKVSQLTAASSLTGAESIPIVQSGNSRKVPVSNILTDNLFTQSGIGTGTPLAQSLQTRLRLGFVSADFTGAATGLTAWGTSALRLNTSGGVNTAFGESALAANLSGFGNTAIGYQALKVNTTGGSSGTGGNTALGAAALTSNTSGDNNTALGFDALFTNQLGYSNTAVGSNALGFGQDGHENVAVGWRALFNGGANVQSTAVGVKSLNANLTGTGNIAIGYFAGAYELGSNAFYVDNQDRTNTAGDKAGAILYGTFNATPSSQTLKVNAALTVGFALTVSSADISISAGNKLKQSATSYMTPENNSTGAEIATTGSIWLNTTGGIKWGVPLVALGGGAAPTLGTIGGSGPATAAQNTWMKVVDSAGAAFYVPAWK